VGCIRCVNVKLYIRNKDNLFKRTNLKLHIVVVYSYIVGWMAKRPKNGFNVMEILHEKQIFALSVSLRDLLIEIKPNSPSHDCKSEAEQVATVLSEPFVSICCLLF